MSGDRLQAGAVLNNRYTILEIVGRGGMGTVYKARDSRLDIIVAAKEMTEKDVTPDERTMAVRQFEREAKLLGQLQHPNLPRVTDYFDEDDHCYLIMEFVFGQTIESVLKRANGQALPLIDVLNWAIELADVLNYLHSQTPPIVFRDIKPANIMLQDDGIVKLIDFGIARRFQAGATKDTLLYGSPGYSPPEQYGRAQTDPRSDVYALGATLHHLVTGRDPSPTPFKFPPLRSVKADLPESLDIFLTKCVEMDEEKRIQTAAEVKSTLESIKAEVLNSERARLAGILPPTSTTNSRPNAPRIVSSRIQAADSSRNMKNLVAILFGVLCVLVIVFAGIKAVSGRNKAQNPGTGVKVTTPDKPGIDKPVATNVTATGETDASFRITTIPAGIKVQLDGKEIGTTPLDVDHASPGKHTLRFLPPADSGVIAATREITLESGQKKEFEIALQSTVSPTGDNSTIGSAVSFQSLEAQEMTGGNPPSNGIQIAVACRIAGQQGKKGLLAVFFYAQDGQTAMKPKAGGEAYQNNDGQLAVSIPISIDSSVMEFPNATLFIPYSAFPVDSPTKVTYRAFIIVDGKSLGQSDVKPLVHQ
ncbi:MAG: serine/threonine-protein kinase [Chthonomonadales bacterium]